MDIWNRVSSWWETSSSSTKVSCIIVLPLILVYGSLAGHNFSGSDFSISHENQTGLGFSLPSASNVSTTSDLGNSSMEAAEPQKPEEDNLDITRKEPEVSTSTNSSLQNSHKVSETANVLKKLSNLERVEAGLSRVRAAIREAKTGNQMFEEPDYVPSGPIYRNPRTFHRSYLEMEKRFRIFIYEEGEPPVFHYSSSLGILGIEGILIHQLEISKFITKDPEKAHVFFLPFSVYSIVHNVFVRESHLWRPMQNTALDYVDGISRKHPYWNRSLGYDHFMLACHDWAPTISYAIPKLFKNSIRVLCNANTSEGFKPSKDVSLPEIYLPQGNMDGLIGGPSPSKRSVLVFYAGGIHGYIRQVLMETWENKDPEVEIHEYLPKKVSYYGMIRKSKYCICPSGYEVASPRMVEALYMGCVPVLIKDHYAKPFADVLNWDTFAVDIPVKEIPNLKKILLSIPQRKYIRMQRRGIQVRKHFEVNFPPKRYDVFHMILHSIWLRRLNIQVHDTQGPS
ncbi:PREDICTED: probable glycosyltransferase At5g03795 isoform X2 [Ipomoea nil]|uniref:probable glycosyltransferase At5g03795 isoform X2 n=1 Tax=Ipomoea nil TaxID=35883 RepID=UPI000900CF3B|nr:PREDICTED: probable glycosyltransferase At5g03795 isoform X2 [Ipomoea nil]